MCTLDLDRYFNIKVFYTYEFIYQVLTPLDTGNLKINININILKVHKFRKKIVPNNYGIFKLIL